MLSAIRADDPAAFEALFRTYRDDLVGFVTSLLHSPDAAQDVVQDLFFWIWHHRTHWTVPGPLNAYLFRAARNRAISELRRNRVPASTEWPAPHGQSTDDRVLTTDLAGAIDRAVGDLPERCRDVFRLRQHELTNAEIADTLRISLPMVEMHMTRATTILRQRLAAWAG